MRWVTDRDRGKMIGPEDMDTKMGLPISEALRELHPTEKYPKVEDLPK